MRIVEARTGIRDSGTPLRRETSLIRQSDSLSVGEYLHQYSNVEKLVQSRKWAVDLLDDLALYHYPTFVHSVHVGRAAYALGGKLAEKNMLSKSDRDTLGLAGLLHDNGKMTLGERGLVMFNSSEVTSPDHPDRLFARQHARNGYEAIKGRTKWFFLTTDEIGLRAGFVIAGHHEFQPNRYPRISDETTASIKNRRSKDSSVREMQRYLAACDQAVGIAMAGQGGHSFIESNLSAEQVRWKLVHDRDGNKTGYFDDIADDVMGVLQDLRIVSPGLPV